MSIRIHQLTGAQDVATYLRTIQVWLSSRSSVRPVDQWQEDVTTAIEYLRDVAEILNTVPRSEL